MRSWTAAADGFFLSIPILWRLAATLLIIALMAALARTKRFLTPGGTAAAAVLGTAVMYIGGISGFVMLLFFFLSASVTGHLLADGSGVEAKGGERDMMQVAANGLPAAIALVLFRISPYPEVFLTAFAASLAEAAADTFSGMIGRLSHRDPVSIITFTRVQRGISGGVTVLGTAAGAAASAVMAFLFLGTFGCSLPEFLITASSGFLGSVLDSFLGASVQVQYRRPDGSLTEREWEGRERNERARGIRWIDNDAVNLISGLSAMALASALAML